MWKTLEGLREPSQAPEFIPVYLVGSVLLIFLIFCVALVCLLTFWVQCCYFRYDFCIQTMFGSSLFQIVCCRVHVWFTLFAYCCVQYILCCVFVLFVFFLCLVYPMMPVSLDCSFLIAHFISSNVYSLTGEAFYIL